MSDLSAGRVVLYSFAAGSSFALGIMACIAIRVAFTVTKGHRWYQLRQL